MARLKRLGRQFKESNGFLCFTPSGGDLGIVHKRASRMGALNGSFTRGLGNMVVCLGELAAEKFLPRCRYVGDSHFSHDIVYKNKKVEVKSKSCASIPLPNYTASINGHKSMCPNNDLYVFTRVRRDLMKVWLVGFAPTTFLLKNAQYRDKGYLDKDGFKTKSSGYNIAIGELRPVLDLLWGVYK